jgi:hypothetical protein
VTFERVNAGSKSKPSPFASNTGEQADGCENPRLTELHSVIARAHVCDHSVPWLTFAHAFHWSFKLIMHGRCLRTERISQVHQQLIQLIGNKVTIKRPTGLWETQCNAKGVGTPSIVRFFLPHSCCRHSVAAFLNVITRNSDAALTWKQESNLSLGVKDQLARLTYVEAPWQSPVSRTDLRHGSWGIGIFGW